MSLAAVIGAGEIGGAVAHALARRARFRRIRLIDEAEGVAKGKALDLRQAGPIDGANVDITGEADPLSAAGASVIVVADAAREGEWQGERGLALVRQLVRGGSPAPLVFAGPNQLWLMETSARELGVSRDRMLAAAPAALAGAARALTAIDLNASSLDISLNVVGRPPRAVIVWSAATVAGSRWPSVCPPTACSRLPNACAGSGRPDRRRLPRPPRTLSKDSRSAAAATWPPRQSSTASTARAASRPCCRCASATAASSNASSRRSVRKSASSF